MFLDKITYRLKKINKNRKGDSVFHSSVFRRGYHVARKTWMVFKVHVNAVSPRNVMYIIHNPNGIN